MYIILSKYESVWPKVWPQDKCRSLWPIFHGPVIMPFSLKTISCMNIIIWDYESVWSNSWPQNKCRSLWTIFHGPVILCYILKTFWCVNIRLWDYGLVWLEVWPQNRLCHCDLFSWSTDFALYLEDYLMDECHIIRYWESVTKSWPQNKCRSTWPIFHGLVILLNIFKIIWLMNIIGIMDQCDTKIDLIKYMSVSDLYFLVQWFHFISWRLFDGEMLYLE